METEKLREALSAFPSESVDALLEALDERTAERDAAGSVASGRLIEAIEAENEAYREQRSNVADGHTEDLESVIATLAEVDEAANL